MPLLGKDGECAFYLFMLANDDPQWDVVKFQRPKKLIVGRVNKQLPAEIGNNDVVCTQIPESNGAATDVLFHYFSLDYCGMCHFPQRPLSDHHNSIHKDK
jgi:hypothetical protein